MLHILQTENLTLRYFTLDDTSFIIQLLNSPGWLEFIGERNVKTNQQAKQYLLNGPMKSYAANGYGLCMAELKDSKTPVGMCGIIKRDTLETPDIGFAFLPEFIGKGYGFEIAKATIQYAKETLSLPVICAITVRHNIKSIKLLEKIGLQFQQNIYMPGEAEELMLFTTEN